ncbi:MAG TPA: hypothetical protein VFG69_20805 [Nannocystaceae bacterium]|nr:hypothetical protein [Nannocystaceae bacterium]
MTLALAVAPLSGASAAPIAGATKKPLPPPADTPPTDTPPAETPPTETPPTDTPPTDTPPTDTPATDTPPADTPPADTPPADEPPADETTPPEPTAPDPYADRPEEPRVGGKPRKGKGLMIAGGSVLGVGIAATITFSLMTRRCHYDGPLQCKLQDQDALLIPLGSAAALLGAMLLAVGIGYHVQYKKWEAWKPGDNEKKKKGRKGRERSKTALVPGLFRGGAGVVWGGKF